MALYARCYGAGIPFLELVIDWYITDKWDFNSSESKEEQGFRLAKAFMKAGDAGRAIYYKRCIDWFSSGNLPPEVTEERVAEVPHDLLTEQERGVSTSWNSCSAIIRTAYNENPESKIEDIEAGIHIYRLQNQESVFDDINKHNKDWRDIVP
ncbi:hypothetical protein BU16DRAFT_556939 [Lophium mytilinum]|uniref:Uncharacterized protein n=1 Tax=Lophium mytilinum TaxID=390894 RepID=A0A6A6R6T7_9PEZI|nr:hypothetical protein BU16DRAFT_556939 [Lophium mytilinum]